MITLQESIELLGRHAEMDGQSVALHILKKAGAIPRDAIVALQIYYKCSYREAKGMLACSGYWTSYFNALEKIYPRLSALLALGLWDLKWSDAVHAYLEAGEEIDLIDYKTGFSLLFMAISVQNPSVVRLLIDRKCNVNIQSPELDMMTPLHYSILVESDPERFSLAGYIDAYEIPKMLLTSGSDILLKDNYQRTPLQLAFELEIGEEYQAIEEAKKGEK